MNYSSSVRVYALKLSSNYYCATLCFSFYQMQLLRYYFLSPVFKPECVAANRYCTRYALAHIALLLIVFRVYLQARCYVTSKTVKMPTALTAVARLIVKRQQHKHVPYSYIRRENEKLVWLLTLHVWRNLELTGTDKWFCKITNTNNHYNKGKIKNKLKIKRDAGKFRA